jgi:hypothetical protein
MGSVKSYLTPASARGKNHATRGVPPSIYGGSALFGLAILVPNQCSVRFFQEHAARHQGDRSDDHGIVQTFVYSAFSKVKLRDCYNYASRMEGMMGNGYIGSYFAASLIHTVLLLVNSRMP